MALAQNSYGSQVLQTHYVGMRPPIYEMHGNATCLNLMCKSRYSRYKRYKRSTRSGSVAPVTYVADLAKELASSGRAATPQPSMLRHLYRLLRIGDAWRPMCSLGRPWLSDTLIMRVLLLAHDSSAISFITRVSACCVRSLIRSPLIMA